MLRSGTTKDVRKILVLNKKKNHAKIVLNKN